MPPSTTVLPHEFILEGAHEVDLGGAADISGSDVRLDGSAATLRAVADRFALAATPALGAHILELRREAAPHGLPAFEPIRVPFFVVRTHAKLPADARVLGFARLHVDGPEVRRLPTFGPATGPYVEIMKVTDRRGRAPRELAFDEKGNPLDPRELYARVRAARKVRYGKLSPSLARTVETTEQKSFRVMLWAATDEVGPDLADKVESSAPDTATLAAWRGAAVARKALVEALSSAGLRGAVRGEDSAAPMVWAEMSRSELGRLGAIEEVAAVYLDEDDTGVLDLANLIAVANVDDVQATGVVGKGVRVAIWEDGPDDTSQLVITDRFDATPETTEHARFTHAIVRNQQGQGPQGVAPAASIYSANTTSRDALRWAAREGCTVISQSFHRSSEPRSGDMQGDDLYKDWLVLHWPYPTIVQAAGNMTTTNPEADPLEDEYVNHKGYNSLVVGNHNDSAGAMSGSSVFRNPETLHGDRELPEICANGTGVSVVGLSGSGTSLSAPAVAGCAALLQEISATLKWWPEGGRAILLAGARRNVRDSTWWKDVAAGVDARDGSGALDAQESARIASARSSRNNQAAHRGWDVGTLRSSHFDADRLSEFAWHVRVPLQGPRHVKVALAWDGASGPLGVTSTLAVDFDLLVFDSEDRLVGYSGSWDNSYEIAEFEGHPGAAYTIRIRRWSGTRSTWFGLAWTVF